SFVNSFEMLENQEYNKSKSDKGYHTVPLPYTRNFIPFKPDLTFMDKIVESENIDVITIDSPSNGKKVKSNHESIGVKSNGDIVEPKTVKKNNFRPPVIEDWNSDDEREVEIIPKDKTISSSTKKIKFVKFARETVEKVETSKQNKYYPRGNQRNWNNLMSQRLGSDFKMINKACFVCGSFEHLHYVCDKKVIRPVWNNSSRVNHKNFANKMTHPHPNRRFVPQAVLTKSGKINTAGASVNTAVRPVNTAGSKPTVNHPRPISNAYKKGYSQVTRPFNKYSEYKNSIFNKKVNTVRVKDTTARDRAVVSENKGKGVNVVKASACWGNPQQNEYKEKGVIDSGCSRHMTRNKCYLTEYEVYDGGFVSFGDGKGRISGKGKIKIGTLDFDDVYFCKELKYNLFSVSQIYDKKNNVLFTNTECLGFSSDFKLLDESQVLLRVPRKDNIYSVDLKSVVPTRDLTCLFAKATIDESNIWHMRLGHINYKTMNKLVRGNIIRGLPSKIFENDHSCVAYQKGNVARTPQQNDVTERKNRTLIEAARTMLVNSKFPTTFWAEAVNTACYVINRVLIIKPHNKTPYELIRGRPLLIDFMKPFGCLVTILNTRGHLGKFDEGFFLLGTLWKQRHIVAGQAEKKIEPEQEYILIPLCITDPLIAQDPKVREVNVGKKAIKVDENRCQECLSIWKNRRGGVCLSTSYFEDPYFPDKVYRVQIDKTLFIKRHKDDILLVHVYVDDIIFGSTKKKLSTEFEKLMHDKFQMSSMGELSFFLELQVQQKTDGIFLSQNKYVAEILKKFDFAIVKTASTPMEPNKALIKDEKAKDVDVHLYKSIIGSLMYLTASRPDITFVVCACARDSPFDLEAFSDSDYAGASLDRKSTTGWCHILSKSLISWQCKKKTIVANSTTKADYVAAVNCYGHNLVFHSKTKHIEIRNHFIRDSYEKKLIQVIKIHTDQNVADLLTKDFDFWQTASASTLKDGEVGITATIDGQLKTVTEASLRRHLKLEDVDGISSLPNTEIFEQLALMGVKEQQSYSPSQTHDVDEAASTRVDVRLGGAATTVYSLDIG
ncbi:ribonuclease H-like domain-containing protein, partial [Tanacetum coccineum]